MASFRKRTMFAVTAGVWLVAAGSAAALAYDLNHLTAGGSKLTTPRGPTAASLASFASYASLDEGQTAQQVLHIPSITVAAPWPHRPVAARAPVVRDISEMNCASWRELDLGSGRVQVCE
jgi:hypothetical protein